MQFNLKFTKTGKEIKEAIKVRIVQLESRLDRRNKLLEKFMGNTRKLRSYLVHQSENDFASHGRPGGASSLKAKGEISSEEKQDINQLCRRIFDLDQEIRKLKLIFAHLDDNLTVELSYNDLIEYGFSVEEG